MGGIDLRKSCLDCLSQLVGDALTDALVYLDAGAGEAFHFIGGLGSILSLGPRAVCSLENASSLDGALPLNVARNEHVTNILIITTHLLSDAHRYILRCLRAHGSVASCTVLTSISEEAHAIHPDTPLGSDAFHEYERLLLEDINDMLQKPGSDEATEDEKINMVLEVKHFPMVLCPLTSTAFVFPSGGTIARAPLSDHGDQMLGIGLPRIDDGSIRSENVPIGGTLLAHFLYNFSGQLGLKFDVFTMGPLSREVGKLLTEISGIADVSVRSRRPAGLLLIDRTLDLITPCCHGDSLMDRFFASLSRTHYKEMLKNSIKRQALDIRLPDAKECKQDGEATSILSKEFCLLRSILKEDLGMRGMTETDSNRTDALHGSLAETISQICMGGISIFDSVKNHESGRIDFLFEKRFKECIIHIKKWIQEALYQERIKLTGRSRLGTISAQEIHSLTSQLSQNPIAEIRHADLIQISKAAEFALGSDIGPKWEALSSAEKILALSVGDSSQSVAFQIRDLIQQSILAQERKNATSAQDSGNELLLFQDALILSIVGYALAGEIFSNSVSGGPFSWEEERELKQTVMDAILLGSDPRFGARDSEASEKQKEPGGLGDFDFGQPDDDQDADNENDEGWGAWGDDSLDDVADYGGSNSSEKSYGDKKFELQVRDTVEEIFKKLHAISAARKYLQVKEKVDESVYFNGSPIQRSLLYRVLSLVFQKADVPGMEHHSSAVSRFLISGLGRFGLGQAKPNLGDNNVIFVFIVGGLNAIEVLEAKEAQAACKMLGVDLIIGGTTFLTPNDLFDLIFTPEF